MTKLLVRLIGTGKDGDPFRVDLPTWEMLEVDYIARTALVRVPDDVFPVSAAVAPAPSLGLPPEHADALVLLPSGKTAMADFLAEAYGGKWEAWNPDNIDHEKA